MKLIFSFALIIGSLPLYSADPIIPSMLNCLAKKLPYDSKPQRWLKRQIAYTGVLDSIEIKETIGGIRGGKRHVVGLKKGKSKWGDVSEYPRSYPDLVLDPRKFVNALGPDISMKFGFELQGEFIVMPDPFELDSAIKSYNKTLPLNDSRRIDVTFYSTENEITTGREYIDKWLVDHQLPLAKAGHIYLHDISAHVGAIFIPKEILELSKQNMNAYLKLFEYIAAKDPSLYNRIKNNPWAERSMIGAIDAGSNDFQEMAYKSFKGEKENFYLRRITNWSDNISSNTTEKLLRELINGLVDYNTKKSDKKKILELSEEFLKKMVAENNSWSQLPYGLNEEKIAEELGRDVESLTSNDIYDAIGDKEYEMTMKRVEAMKKYMADTDF